MHVLTTMGDSARTVLAQSLRRHVALQSLILKCSDSVMDVVATKPTHGIGKNELQIELWL